jgi:hypothetical protein
VLAAVVVVGAVTAIVVAGGDHAVAGRAAPAEHTPVGTTAPLTPPTSSSRPPVEPLAPQDGWSTLSNPASGLSYQIPPGTWATQPTNGTVGSVTLAQGAERTAYTCGKPVERLLRGLLGSGGAPRIDPAGLATAVAQAAATQYYATNSAPPKVTVDAALPMERKTRAGVTIHGVLVRATATQHADPCLATTGEVLVVVLRFADHDGVLLVNADIAGGPHDPAPATDRELRTIVATVHPTD